MDMLNILKVSFYPKLKVNQQRLDNAIQGIQL
jgi:hypothetical protein